MNCACPPAPSSGITVNVAAPGTIGLTRMLRLTGKVGVSIPTPVFGGVAAAGRRIGLPALSEDFRRLLVYGRAVDITRLVDEIGYAPHYSAAEAVADYGRHQGGRRILPSLREVAVGR